MKRIWPMFVRDPFLIPAILAGIGILAGQVWSWLAGDGSVCTKLVTTLPQPMAWAVVVLLGVGGLLCLIGAWGQRLVASGIGCAVMGSGLIIYALSNYAAGSPITGTLALVIGLGCAGRCWVHLQAVRTIARSGEK